MSIFCTHFGFVRKALVSCQFTSIQIISENKNYYEKMQAVVLNKYIISYL